MGVLLCEGEDLVGPSQNQNEILLENAALTCIAAHCRGRDRHRMTIYGYNTWSDGHIWVYYMVAAHCRGQRGGRPGGR